MRIRVFKTKRNNFVIFSLTNPKHPCYNGTHQGGIRGMRYLHNTQTETQNRGCSIGDNRHGTFSIFLLHDNSDKNIPKHNKFLNSRESYAILHFTQRLCRWVFPGLCRLGRHKAFNLHYFRPYLFWHYLKKSNLSHFPNKP